MSKYLFALILLSSISTPALAGETYGCVGKVEGERTVVTISFEDLKSLTITDDNGDDHELDFAKTTSKYKYFGDYGYDGYGGFLEVRVPAGFEISGSNAAEEFRVKFQRQTYSEAGHVGSYVFYGNCQRQDN